MKRVAYVDDDGRTADLTPDEAERVLERDPELRREYAKWTAMTGGRGGRLIVLEAERVMAALQDDETDDAV